MQKYIHNVCFFRDGEQIPHEALEVGEVYLIIGINDQTYEEVSAEARIINLYHMRQFEINGEIFGFSPKKNKALNKMKLKGFVYEKTNCFIEAAEAQKLIPKNLVYAIGTIQDKNEGKKDVYTSRVLNIFAYNGVIYFETLNTLYKCE